VNIAFLIFGLLIGLPPFGYVLIRHRRHSTRDHLDSAKSLKISLIVVCVLSIAFLIFGLLIGLPPFGYVLIVGIVAIPTLVYVWRSIRGG
jgi:hypothetical protein